MLNCFSFVHIFFIFIISIIGNVVLGSSDNWSKKSHSLSHKGAVRYKTAHYIGVQRYNTIHREIKMNSQGGSTESSAQFPMHFRKVSTYIYL